MTFLELVTGSNQAERNSSAFIPGKDSYGTAAGRGNSSTFEDLLNSSRIKNYQAAASSPEPYRARGSGPGSVDGKKSGAAGFVSFREAKEYSEKATSGAAGGKEAAESASPGEELGDIVKNVKKGPEQGVVGSILGMTAQLLGIGADDLQRLLNTADTASWRVNDIMSITEAASYLSQALGLNNGQQDTLEELLVMAAELLELPVSYNADVQDDIFPENNVTVNEGAFSNITGLAAHTGNSIPAEEDMDSFIEKLSEHIKVKLDEFGIRLAADQDSAEEEIKAMMMLSAENPGVKEQTELEHDKAKTGTAGTVSVQTSGEAVKKPADTEDDSGMDAPAGDMSGDNEAGLKMADGGEFRAAVQLTQVNQAVENPAAIADKTTEAIIQPRDIINQVVEKVKVILTPEKSEIAMELKPDSLGRVSLKVSTENGLVMARFVAENQQVKQVLEANMQILKDSLESQGINVQGFSVSVRQESDGYHGNGPGSGENGRTVSAVKAYPGLSLEADIPELTGVLAVKNPYLWNYSTIDLTA
jgi:flagellar hook-length control protein FliK